MVIAQIWKEERSTFIQASWLLFLFRIDRMTAYSIDPNTPA
jgi:hypothetical protein